MFDGLFSPTRLDGGMQFVPTEGGSPSAADRLYDTFPARDVAYSYQEQCDDDSYLVVPTSQNRFGGSPLKRLLPLCKTGWAGLAKWIRALMP